MHRLIHSHQINEELLPLDDLQHGRTKSIKLRLPQLSPILVSLVPKEALELASTREKGRQRQPVAVISILLCLLASSSALPHTAPHREGKEQDTIPTMVKFEAKRGFDSYFTEVSAQKRAFYIFLVLYVGLVVLVSVAEPLLTPSSCLEPIDTNKEFGNSLFKYNPCRYERKDYLLYLTPDECSCGRRLVISVILGGFIGWERRQADRPAGIRTMALVSLGSCLFTINSAFAFLDGPMGWDASRISAAIPSGVGFLGAGLIFKQAEKDEKSGDVTHGTYRQ